MKKYLFKLLTSVLPWVIIAIVGFLFAKGLVNPNPDSDNGPNSKTDTVIEYIQVHDTCYIDKPITDTFLLKPDKEIVEIMVEKDIDTAEIIRSYFGKRVVNDTLINDSALFFAIRDTIFMNDILSREVNYKLAERLKTITNTIYMKKVERNRVFVGGGLSYTPLTIDVMVGAAFEPKNKRALYVLEFGIFERSVKGTIFYRLKLKKDEYKQYGLPTIGGD